MTEANHVESSRRMLLKSAAGVVALAALPGAVARAANAAARTAFDLNAIEKVAVNGRINQGICGCGLRLSIEQKCELISKMGLKSMDFTGPNDWPTLKKYNLVASLCAGAGSIGSRYTSTAPSPWQVSG